VVVPALRGQPWGWIAAAAGFALLWLLTLAWGWRRRRAGPGPADTAAGVAATPPSPSRADLRRALDSGSLDDVVSVLGAMGGVHGLDALLAHLADADQRDALRAMQAARWSQTGGDVAQTRQALRRAFHDGPHWRARPAAENTVLPPLYPSGR